MILELIKEKIKKDDEKFIGLDKNDFIKPDYDPEKHYLHLTSKKYYLALLYLRHYIKLVSDYYFGMVVGAKNVDLFMLTPSVSSPIGPGSDSEAIPIKFGKLDSFLVDSSQFGFEPLAINQIEKVYCYLPSMRGENPDKRHLNQFFHCEMEIKGKIDDLRSIIEDYVKVLCETVLSMDNILKLISVNSEMTKMILKQTINKDRFEKYTFDEAVEILENNNKKHLVNYTDKGRDISSKGELEIMNILNTNIPIWVNNYDRDRVPFYQKPSKDNDDRVVNGDLLFPPIEKSGFGGEIVGCGQRQDNPEEMYESLKRQGLSSSSYEWYINLRKQDNYNTTSGFGLGIERFIAWSLGLGDIKDVIIYPRLKNIITYP